MSAIEFKQSYFDALLNLLWRQWSRLGVAGQISPQSSPYVLDPESLLLFSAYFCRYDQRLYDLIIDWLQENGGFINMQRLKTIGGKAEYDYSASLGFIASQLNPQRNRKWRKTAVELIPETTVTTPMFLLPDGTSLEYCPHIDEAALKYGFIRNTYRYSGKVCPFPLQDCATILLQLRGIFGLSARAETILALLNKETCKIQDIAELSGFSWKSIQDVIAELSATPVVSTHEENRRGRCYFLNSPEKIRQLFETENFVFPDWGTIFNILFHIWKTVSNPRLAHLSDQTFRGEIERVFLDNTGRTFLHTRIDELKFIDADKFTLLPEILDKL
ncbi:MAG: hypothetical protein JXR78_09405 [Victivallales bacterium]|nr:hypothetical protein [Victivallales bacterium]